MVCGHAHLILATLPFGSRVGVVGPFYFSPALERPPTYHPQAPRVRNKDSLQRHFVSTSPGLTQAVRPECSSPMCKSVRSLQHAFMTVDNVIKRSIRKFFAMFLVSTTRRIENMSVL